MLAAVCVPCNCLNVIQKFKILVIIKILVRGNSNIGVALLPQSEDFVGSLLAL